MASITRKMVYPNMGAVWQAAVKLWEEYVPNEDWTFSASIASVDSHNVVQIVIDDGTDETTYDLFPQCQMNGANLGADFFGQPGWTYNPGPKLATYGSRTTWTDFNSNIVALRGSIYSNFCGDFDNGSQSTRDCTLNILSAHVKLWYTPWVERSRCGVDVIACPKYTASTDYEWGEDRVGNEGILPPNLTIALSGGGGSVDLTETNEILQDIALADADYTANNGASIFTMRCKVRAD